MRKRILQIVCAVVLLGVLVLVVIQKPRKPSYPRWAKQEEILKKAGERRASVKDGSADISLIESLLRENLSKREFDFSLVAEAVSGRKVIPLADRKSGPKIQASIAEVLKAAIVEMNAPNSPLKGLRRINEGSRYFEDSILKGLDGMPGITCEIPHTRDGGAQRSGYPDLKITDDATGEIYYLDPKLMEKGSIGSSLRTFYFEPKSGTLKILDDATHLLVGIEHDGKDGDWKFLGWRLVDLSGLKVRLKAEFQASNKDVYQEPMVLETN